MGSETIKVALREGELRTATGRISKSTITGHATKVNK